MSDQRPRTMRAAIFRSQEGIGVFDVPVPQPGPGQALVRMWWASVCGSDVHMIFDGLHDPAMEGRPGFPGHEGVGEVIAGDLSTALPGVELGSAVLTAPVGSAGGCFADYQVVDATQLVPIPDGLDPKLAMMAQQLGTTVFALHKFWPHSVPPQVAVVQGAGSAGTFFEQQLLAQGVGTVIVSEPLEHRRAIALDLGATAAVAPEDLGAAVLDLSDGLGADLVIEAAGFDVAREQAVGVVKYAGTIGCFGFPERGGLSPFPVYDCFRKALDVRWSVGAQIEPGIPAFREAMRMIARGVVRVDYCIGEIYPLERVADALAAAREYAGVKSTVTLR